ncbi:MAG: hypothetical protein HQK99_05670 [Nitrospirae bacterium]|nr:hypothetical protein [Nitrospirota bacterium]
MVNLKKLFCIAISCIILGIAGIGTVYAGNIQITSNAVTGTGIFTVTSAQVTQSSSNTVTLTIATVGGFWTGAITTNITAGTSDYSIGTNTCAGNGLPAGTCNIGITFAPVASGTRTGTLTITFANNGGNVYNNLNTDAPGPADGFATISTGGGGTTASVTISLTGTALPVPAPLMTDVGQFIWMFLAGLGGSYTIIRAKGKVG